MRSEVQVLLDPPSVFARGKNTLPWQNTRVADVREGLRGAQQIDGVRTRLCIQSRCLALPLFCWQNDGALAQLGERLICIQEVSGSIPLGSTNSFLWK